MAVNTYTSADYIQLLKAAILARNNSYDTEIGPIPDLIINPLALTLEQQSLDIRRLQSLLLLMSNSDYTHDDLVAFVGNEGIVPDNGSGSTVELVFSTAQVTRDLTVQAGYPVSTAVDESTGDSRTFVTTTTTTLSYTNRASYYNANTGMYELHINAICTSRGIDTNIGANRINRPLRPLVGFDYVSNPEPATGGRDATSDAELIEQFIIAITGTNSSVVDGIRRTVRDLFTNVIDSAVVYGDDPLLTRAATDAGAVDVWVANTVSSARTDIVTFIGHSEPIPLARQPVMGVASVSNGGITYVEGSDYDIVYDTGGTSGSVRGQDAVVFRPDGNLPAPGTSITINYTQNSLVEDVQNLFDSQQHVVMGRDLLVRAAKQRDLVITATVTVKAGYDATQAKVLARQQIYNYINSMLLGARIPDSGESGSIQMSDVNAYVRRISALDNITFTTFTLASDPVGAADITISKLEYPRIDINSITIN